MLLPTEPPRGKAHHWNLRVEGYHGNLTKGHKSQRMKRTCLGQWKRWWLTGGSGKERSLGVHQKAAVASNEAGEVGGLRPFH